jgi:predicted ABC-class ATPase
MHKKGIEKSVPFLCPEKEKIEMEKKKVRATRTNGKRQILRLPLNLTPLL